MFHVYAWQNNCKINGKQKMEEGVGGGEKKK